MVKKLILLVCSISLILPALELGVRYRFQAWPFESVLHVPDYLTPRESTLRWRFSASDGRNSLGLRNRELGPKKIDTSRILFLGDSLFWSGETSSGELFTEELEHRLNSQFLNGPDTTEIINAGIPGYTTYQELEFLKIHGLDMEPDIVVLGFVFNDLYYKYLHRPTEQNLLAIEPTTHLYHFNPSTFPGIILARSYLAHFIVDKIEVIWKMILQRPIFPFEQRKDFYLAWKSYGWNHVRDLIGEMQAILSEREISLFVIVFPVSDQVNDQYRNLDEAYVLFPQTKILEILDGYSIPTLDLTESIYRNGGITLYRDYLHLNGEGNDILTDELENFLLDKSG